MNCSLSKIFVKKNYSIPDKIVVLRINRDAPQVGPGEKSPIQEEICLLDCDVL